MTTNKRKKQETTSNYNELKTNNKNEYKLFGTMNLFHLYPDFVLPVFENNGNYYLSNSENSIEIDSFYKIQNEKHINEIKPLTTSFNKLINIKGYYTIGDVPLVAFQIDKDKYFIGTIYTFNDFIKDIKIKDKILSQQIYDFQNEIKKSKLVKSRNINKQK